MRLVLIATFLLCHPLFARARAFDIRRDTFAFANETVFHYRVDEGGSLHVSKREDAPDYSHRCFVMSRAIMQFWQFTRFAPERPRLSREEYVRLVRRVCRIPVWSTGPRERIVVPGFRDLWEFSEDMPAVFQENIGSWVPSYFRVGNFRMAMGHLRWGQARAARWLEESLRVGRIRTVYLARFPSMNHCVVVYRMESRANGDVRFWVNDVNYPGKPARLDYIAAQRSFEFEPRFYFPGGRVNVMRVYISAFH
jgi:hypothetical protein